ncbi:MAG: SPFH domain-containing protein [Clostridia bacterium]|nr:SPFH domain-containing protein [Clostridia bacterium]MDD4376113.1 SPFH domain-containing protein [Clostridia bacterium]
MGALLLMVILFLVFSVSALVVYSFKSMSISMRRGIGVPLISCAIIVPLIIGFYSFVKKVEATHVGVVVNSRTRQVVNAGVGYNVISPFESLKKIQATVVSFTHETDEEAGVFYGAQTKNGSYVTLISKVSVKIQNDKANIYYQKFGDKTLKAPEMEQYVISKLEKNLLKVFTKYEPNELMKEKGPLATEEIIDLLREDLLSDGIYLENLINADIEGDKTSEDILAQIQQVSIKREYEEKLKETIQAANENKRLQAEGDKTAAIIKAEGEAEALIKMNEALASNVNVIELKRLEVLMKFAEKWKGDTPTVNGTGNLLGIDLNEFIKTKTE